MSQRKINSFFGNQLDNSQSSNPYNKRGALGKDMPWSSSSLNKYNPVLNRYHNTRREVSSKNHNEKMNYATIKPQNNFSNGPDSQGNHFSISSQSQDSYGNTIGGNSLSLETSSMKGGASEYELSLCGQSKQCSEMFVKQELKQMSNLYQVACDQQQERQLMEQVVEVSKSTEKELITYKQQNEQVQRLIIKKIGDLQKEQGEAASAQVKLLESIQLATTSDEVNKNMESMSTNLKTAVESIKEDVGKSLIDVGTTLSDILKEVKSKQPLRCDVYTQYSPQVALEKKTALNEVTNQSPFGRFSNFTSRKRIKQSPITYPEKAQLNNRGSSFNSVYDTFGHLDKRSKSETSFGNNNNQHSWIFDESQAQGQKSESEDESDASEDVIDESSEGEDINDWFD